jgi:hypothetical protein
MVCFPIQCGGLEPIKKKCGGLDIILGMVYVVGDKYEEVGSLVFNGD